MGVGAWPGFVELAGLGLLTVWSVRSASRTGALASVVAFGSVMVAIVEWRKRGYHSDLLLLLCAAAWAAVVAAGWYLRVLDARQLEQSQQVRHQERLAIARELHDVVAHHVTGIVVQAQAAQLIAAQQPDAAQRALDTIARAGGDALAAMRAMVGALRDESTGSELVPTASLDDLRAMAEWTASGARRAAGAAGDRRSCGNAPRHGDRLRPPHRPGGRHQRPPALRRRHEHRHRRALRRRHGPPPRHQRRRTGQPLPGGFGLRGMAERAAAMGGEFDAGPLPDGGWRVAADLPVAVGSEVATT